MPYIIDGHNLIPKIPGLSLQDIDDELQLIKMLQEFCRLHQKKAEVYFDNASPGQLKVQKFGNVAAFFVRAGQPADQAIRKRLSRLGKEARNWSVISSDREVQAIARAAHASVISSQIFAKQLVHSLEETITSPDSSEDPVMSPEEVEDWLKVFGESDESAEEH